MLAAGRWRIRTGETMTDALGSRRAILQQWLAATSAGAVGAMLAPGDAHAQLLPATPSCGAGEATTIAQTEGPFFKAATPEKRDFRRDAQGEAFTLVGFVVDRRCQPIAGALVELWHADARGAYDNEGYRLRGHQIADAQGRYMFETIMPGVYTGRTRHFHVKAQAPRGRVLTTQLYFPDEAANRRDGIFDRRLLMRVENASDGKVGRFDFVLSA
jgi:protocatechuate 3,4-dioxygenase beta subunit